MKQYNLIILFTTILFVRAIAVQAQFITIAGKGTAGYSGDGGPATLAELNFPSGIAIDGIGNIYISDRSNGRIRKINSSGIITTFAGNGLSSSYGDGLPATAAEISPNNVAVDGNGNVYIADQGNNRIRKVNSSGICNTIAGNGLAAYGGDGGPATLAALNWPSGVTLDGKGNIYIADVLNSVIRKVDSFGIISTFAGNGIAGYSGDGVPATATELKYPGGVAVDNAGNVYIADGGLSSRIRIVNTMGIINTFAGTGLGGYSGDGGPATAAQIGQALDVATDIAGNVYLPDEVYNCVRKVSTSGIISTISGPVGLGTTSSMSGPTAVVADNKGNILIADKYNNRILKTSATGNSINNIPGAAESIKIYPNPNNGKFTIQMLDITNYGTITIMDLLGKIVETRTIKKSSAQYVDFSLDISEGIYIVKIVVGDNTYREKIVVW